MTSGVAGPSNRSYVYLISLVAAVGGFLFGYDISIISGAVIFLRKQFALSPAQLGFAIASASLGCISGPFLAGWLSDRIGRKRSLILADVLFGICAVGTATTAGIREFNVYRIIGGIGVGVASVVSPMYIAEVAPTRIRGRLVTLNQLAIVIGSTSSIVVSYFLSFSGNWRAMFASALVPVGVLLVGLFFVPESPRWLVESGRDEEALKILTQVDGAENAALAVREIQETTAVESGRITELFQPGIRTALLIAVTLGLLQQWTGVSPLTFYAPIIFQKAGFKLASDALAQTILFNIWNFACTVAALLLVDRVGRRPLLLLGTTGMVLGQLLMGTFFHFKLTGTYVVAAMFLCVGAYAMSLAPLTWLIMSEVFPTRIRAKGQAAGSLAVWIGAFTSTQAFAPATQWLETRFGSPAGVFWIFAAVCAAAVLFENRVVPETKGRSIEAIGKSWTMGSETPSTIRDLES
jgi:sugar porter (SP) family MFS transporter